jgi:outer membrane protein OmpA-like peptidoglycan-associated protein
MSFGLIVTAEPYYAVAFPSDIVVFENVARKDTKGKAEPIKAKGELFKRGQYSSLPTITIDPKDKTPMEIYQARNAVAAARAAQADTFGGDAWTKAQGLLDKAENLLVAKKSKEREEAPTYARQAVQAAEDARTIAIQRAEEARLAAEQKAAAEAAAKAKAEAEAETARRSAAETAAAQAQQAAESSRREAEIAQKSGAEFRAQLLKNFNAILPTQDTPRGLVVNLGGVNFATGKADLSGEAREKLARFSGLVASYPRLKLEIEGHTDNVGNPESNRKLSQGRADAVRDYLVNQGVKPEAIVTKGLGDTMPIADNSTPDGRTQNRRVEIIVSGEVIGKQIGQ